MKPLEFIYLSTMDDQQFDPFPFYLEMIPKKLGDYLKEKYLWKKFPVKKERITVLGVTGDKVTIPFTRKELNKYEDTDITRYIEGIFDGNQAKNIVAVPVLKNYMGNIPYIEGRKIYYRFLPDILRNIRRKHQISKKEMAIIIMDEEAEDIPLLLKEVADDLNFLTIVTEWPERYAEYEEELYESTGLVARVVRTTEISDLSGNIILDFHKEADKLYRYYPEDAVILELSNKIKKTKDLLAKRKDMHVYNCIEVFLEQEKVNSDILEAVLISRNNSTEFSRSIRIDCSLTLGY